MSLSTSNEQNPLHFDNIRLCTFILYDEQAQTENFCGYIVEPDCDYCILHMRAVRAEETEDGNLMIGDNELMMRDNDLILSDEIMSPPVIRADIPYPQVLRRRSENDEEKIDPVLREVISDGINDMMPILRQMRDQFITLRVNPSNEDISRFRLFGQGQSPSLYDLNEHLYESCSACNQKIAYPKVILHCKCEYHLDCYKIMNANETCIKCGDKVHKKLDEDYAKCPICLEYLKDDVRKMQCNHRFHQKCIRQWTSSVMSNNNKCPICRTHIRF